jgi:RNA polymerase sigma-70 factor (ECF subfamily)
MLRDAADTEEVVQDVFVKAYTHVTSFRRELPFEVWFTRILTNSCRDRIRRRSQRKRRVVSVHHWEPARRDVWNSMGLDKV